MLFINDQLLHIDNLKKKHIQLITCYVNRKIYGVSIRCADFTCAVCSSGIRKSRSITPQLMKAFGSINISKVISGDPKELEDQNKIFNSKYFHRSRLKKFNKAEKKAISSVFNYSWFVDKKNKIYNAYDMCNELKIESCVYCNRIYTSTVITQKGEKIIRPTLDHWFSQKDYPILALSFYNLIPSCSPCNSSVKHDAEFELNHHVHPYVEKNITANYKLDYIYDKSLKNFKILILTDDRKIKKTLKELYIEEIYSHHQSEIADLDLLKRKYNKNHLIVLGAILDKKLTEKDVYRILFGTEYDDDSFHKRPMSKLKRDILNFKLK